jgi:hypothetical protein
VWAALVLASQSEQGQLPASELERATALMEMEMSSDGFRRR